MNGSNQPKTNPTITLTKGVGKCNLILSDNGETRTLGNNVVTWKCGKDVSEIIDIFFKKGDKVFQVGPQKKPNNSDWFAITKNTSVELTEDYGIKWKDSQDNTCILDPTIKVEPNEN